MRDYRNLDIQKYYDNPSPKTVTLAKKRQDIIDNVGDKYIATMKWDGEFAIIIKDEEGVFVRGRSLNVKGVYEDKSVKIPHIVKEFEHDFPLNTVLIAELCSKKLGMVSTDVGKIMRCLPKTAVARQANEDSKLVLRVFDILQYDGEALEDKGYQERIEKAFEVVKNGHYIKMTNVVGYNVKDMPFAEFADSIIAAGGEGAVLVAKDLPYSFGKRPSWQTLKLKQSLNQMELKVCATLPPNKEYTGKDPEIWKYAIEERFVNGVKKFVRKMPIDDRNIAEGNILTLVTKPYYKDWAGVVRVDYEGTMVDVSSGLTDDDKEWLVTEEAKGYIAQGRLIAVVKAMMEASNGSLRHPKLIELRVIE